MKKISIVRLAAGLATVAVIAVAVAVNAPTSTYSAKICPLTTCGGPVIGGPVTPLGL